MPRVLRGNTRDLPEGMTPMEWAAEVFALMDQGYTEREARDLVRLKHEREKVED